MKTLRALWRLARVVVHSLYGAAICALVFPFLKPPQRMHIVGRWSAQMLTVLASALGPLLLAKCHAATGSYAMVFYTLAGLVTLLALAAWFVRLPARARVG